jgi:hypothetical protein
MDRRCRPSPFPRRPQGSTFEHVAKLSYGAGVESPARPKPKSMLSTRDVPVPASAKPAADGPLRKTASRSGRAFWSVAATATACVGVSPVGCSLPLVASLNSRMQLPSALPVSAGRGNAVVAPMAPVGAAAFCTARSTLDGVAACAARGTGVRWAIWSCPADLWPCQWRRGSL